MEQTIAWALYALGKLRGKTLILPLDIMQENTEGTWSQSSLLT